MSHTVQGNENRLAREKSPYLLQHKNNPVDWYPWGEEAFERAKKEDKPVFLSIGYSTCHWCHVMEKESFEDEEVAKILNDHFIAIKVDREERPDIDAVYMDVCQKTTGSSGWPLSVFITHDQKPLFAGTYFSKKSMYGRIGFVDLLTNIHTLWVENKASLLEKRDALMEHIQSTSHEHTLEINQQVVDRAYEQLKADFDVVDGGFGQAPKFPTPHNLFFLFNYYKVYGSEEALTMSEKTLDAMFKGGIYDHIGGGFSRYATDKRWLVPHFEKMLYDNALLIKAYTMGYHLTKKPRYKYVVEHMFAYLKRDMMQEQGAFYSAEDADSEGVEGKFYVFSKEEILQVLGKQDGERFCQLYDATPSGNFEGNNILNLLHVEIEDILEDEQWVNGCKSKLLAYRDKRVRPHLDDKILTAWNGLMIGALAYTSRYMKDFTKDSHVLENQHKDLYLEAAIDTAVFIKEHLSKEDGGLYVRYRHGEVKHDGFLDDYAFMIWGLLELYETTFDPLYLQWATDLNQYLIEHFWDDEKGGFFLYSRDSETLITRPKEIYDGAIPSGNSVAALNLLKLSRLTGDVTLEHKAKEIVSAFAHQVNHYPRYHTFLMQTLIILMKGSRDLVVAGSLEDMESIKTLIHQLHHLDKDCFTILINDGSDTLLTLNPSLKDKGVIQDKPTIYLCENHVCRAPITDIDEAMSILMNTK